MPVLDYRPPDKPPRVSGWVSVLVFVAVLVVLCLLINLFIAGFS
jgi:hypothetical protein